MWREDFDLKREVKKDEFIILCGRGWSCACACVYVKASMVKVVSQQLQARPSESRRGTDLAYKSKATHLIVRDVQLQKIDAAVESRDVTDIARFQVAYPQPGASEDRNVVDGLDVASPEGDAEHVLQLRLLRPLAFELRA